MTEQKRNIEGVVYLSELKGSFEGIYSKLRKSEGRDYDDSIVKNLPVIDKYHCHYKEWKTRDNSSKMICSYIGKNKNAKCILELGCGNGWLTNRLSEIENSEVWGLDVNAAELRQAVRVFGSKENIVFACGDIYKIDQEKLKVKFDYIIMPAVLAYFADPAKLIVKLTELLNSGGEIHIIDSPFYDDVHAAKERSRKYFESLGCIEMIKYYHHHNLDALNEFEYKILYDPGKLFSRIKRFFSAASPFYWIKITR